MIGKWQGVYFILNDSQEKTLEETFVIEITSFSDDEFSGECVYVEAKEKMEGAITITGFIDGDTISFIKKYPVKVFVNENGEKVVDKSKPGQEVEYCGEYDPEQNCYSGEWNLIENTKEYAGRYFDDILVGKWEMKRS